MSPAVDPVAFGLFVFACWCGLCGVLLLVWVGLGEWFAWRALRRQPPLLVITRESFPLAGLELALDVSDVDWRWPAGR